ncbi:MAG: YesL family protein [Clostridiales bacterium]|nr:YesL family protein [Clostridiales bacterium]
MNFKPFNYDSKFSTVMSRILDLIVLNFIFLITCIPIFTIGAAISSLYASTLKIVRKEDGYLIRGYFKAFRSNFKQATAFWLIALLLYFFLYVTFYAASLNGESLTQVYSVISLVLAILYSLYFLTVFPLIATFENTFRQTAYNAFAIMVAHFPAIFSGYLCVAVPFIICFFINTIIMEYSSLFWMLIGFSLLFLWHSVYLNKVFTRYRGEEDGQ